MEYINICNLLTLVEVWNFYGIRYFDFITHLFFKISSQRCYSYQIWYIHSINAVRCMWNWIIKCKFGWGKYAIKRQRLNVWLRFIDFYHFYDSPVLESHLNLLEFKILLVLMTFQQIFELIMHYVMPFFHPYIFFCENCREFLFCHFCSYKIVYVKQRYLEWMTDWVLIIKINNRIIYIEQKLRYALTIKLV